MVAQRQHLLIYPLFYLMLEFAILECRYEMPLFSCLLFEIPSISLTCSVNFQIVPAVTELVVAELLWLDHDNPSKPIYFYINSPGTQVGIQSLAVVSGFIFFCTFAIKLTMHSCLSTQCNLLMGLPSLLY